MSGNQIGRFAAAESASSRARHPRDARVIGALLSALAAMLMGGCGESAPENAKAEQPAGQSAATPGDPGRWRETGRTEGAIYYMQGVTADLQRNFYWGGTFFGLYRSDDSLKETGANHAVIPPEVMANEGYNHSGDPSWDPREGGRILLPLECFYPGHPNGDNTCMTGAIGVADPVTLQWRYYVKLDPSEIPKAMWNEVSPDGELIWTSVDQDLVAYRAADVNPANAGPDGPVIRQVRRLPGGVPPLLITGATFYGGRLFTAGQKGDLFQVWSVDVETGDKRLEIERHISGESEGMATADAFGGVLHWMINPIPRGALEALRPGATEGGSPVLTYPRPNMTLLSFSPEPGAE